MALHVGSREEHPRHDALGDAKLAAELLQRLWEHKNLA
jgi:hypothetical protein